MRNRKPYELKSVIITYNSIQIAYCIYLLYKTLTVNKPIFLFWKCHDVSESNDPDEYFYFKVIFWGRVMETIETVVFALRKKYNQISVLHVFHHSIMIYVVAMSAIYHFSKLTKYLVIISK